MKPDNQSAFECPGYSVTLTPQRCCENQLSLFCLPGWPCHECEAAVGLAVAQAPVRQNAPRRPRLPAWLKNASAAVRRDYLKERESGGGAKEGKI